MNAQQAGLMQMQLRHNAEDLQGYLTDLQSWEEEIKEKDKNLSKQKPILKEDLPPIRTKSVGNHSPDNAKKKRKKKKHNTDHVKTDAPSQSRIQSFDYKAWDKFDVDKACEDVDYGVQSSSSTSDESASELEEEEEDRKRQQAVMEKEKGNTHFKKGQYELAEESYTKAIELDPVSAVMPANRAMARLKLMRYEDAEKDCCLALALDDSYVKAYFRRATARVKLGKLEEAKLDYEAMLRLEPGNKQAKADLANLEGSLRELALKKGFVFPVKRPLHLRSKKPLKRVCIEDIGGVLEQPSSNQPSLVIGEGTDENKPKSQSSALATLQSLGSAPTTYDSSSSLEATKLAPTSGLEATPTKLAPTSGLEATPTLSTQTTNKVKNTQAAVSTHKENGVSISVPDTSDAATSGTKMEVVQQTLAETSAESALSCSDHKVKQKQQIAIPGVPETSLQFQADWKRLKGYKTALASYFKSIPPSKYPVVLQQSLETNVFSEIISILHNDYIRSGTSCLQELIALTKVKRFSVAIMFLSRKDKQSLVPLFRTLMDITTEDRDKSTIASLCKDYSIEI